MRRKKAKQSPKRVLRLPDLDFAKSAVLNPLRSSESKRSYRFAIDDFVAWYCSEPRLAFNKTVVLRYRLELESRRLSSSTITLRLAAVRRLAYEAADTGLLSPELAANIRRVKGAKRIGVKLGNWLSAEQAKVLVQAPDVHTMRGKRDRAIISLLVGCWPAPLRGRWPEFRRYPAARRTMGHSRSLWQRRSHPNRAGSRMGQGSS